MKAQLEHYFWLVFALGIVSIVLWYAFPPVRFTNLPFPVSKPVYHSGEPIAFTIKGCMSGEYPMEIDAHFKNDFILPLTPKMTVSMPRGCFTREFVGYKAEPILPPGKYSIEGISKYQVSPLIWREVPWTTEEFTIVR